MIHPQTLLIRDERPDDAAAIAQVTRTAFATAEHSSGTEEFIIAALRSAGQLSLSLVAQLDGGIIGHVAISPVEISDGARDWYGLGPVSVLPDCQGTGVGSRLIRASLDRLRASGARGCVVLGEPSYYGRFGFSAHPALSLPDVPPAYFQALGFAGQVPAGTVRYHASFEATS